MSLDIPKWARDRAKALAEKEATTDLGDGANLLALSCYMGGFARYIAEHEEAPADPLWGEAHKLSSTHHTWADADEFEAATGLALAALRRGMELAREQSNA